MESDSNTSNTMNMEEHHRHREHLGKAMPVTSLLLNFPPPSMSSIHSNLTRDGYASDEERPPQYFSVNESLPSNVKCHTGENDDDDDDDDDMDDNKGNGCDGKLGGDNRTKQVPCLRCTLRAPEELCQRSSAINEMCRRLCTDECRSCLTLTGFIPASDSALSKSKEKYITADNVERPLSRIAMQRKHFLNELLVAHDLDDNLVESGESKDHQLDQVDKIDNSHMLFEIDASEIPSGNANAITISDNAAPKSFREKYEIAEALAKTSALTSTTQMKQRLAARKLEIDAASEKSNAANMNRDAAATGCSHNKGTLSWQGVAATEPIMKATTDGDVVNDCVAAETASRTSDAMTHTDVADNCVDTMSTKNQKQQGQQQNLNEYELPRELLLYLVRMGSFNSAPKINNMDSQDDDLIIPEGLNTNELLEHVKNLRGMHQPPLLNRYFVKPSLTAHMTSNDISAGLSSLKLQMTSREDSVKMLKTSPNHIRLLQWNILSQTLGQKNDGFVRCPEEALTWENRKFLIVEEILQHNPDIICLQEVDHFKFLQNILGTQNYEGIFFPKPDSPCLYIEENNGPDGCAIFYRRDKFELKRNESRILEVWRVQSNQVAVAANLLIKASGKEICICTTHLKARHGSLLSKLRNEQGRDLIRFVKQFAGSRPIVLCGDFNAEPIEPVYSTILNCDLLKLSSAYADIKTEQDHCNNVAADDADDHHNDDALTEGTGTCDGVENSIKREPQYTTWKIRSDGEECHTIDYIFYTKDSLKVKNCLDFPRAEEIGSNRTPSFQYPSDHFSLVCDFEIYSENGKIDDNDDNDDDDDESKH